MKLKPQPVRFIKLSFLLSKPVLPTNYWVGVVVREIIEILICWIVPIIISRPIIICRSAFFTHPELEPGTYKAVFSQCQ